MCFAPALAVAKQLVRAGADAIVIEGSEAGGHIGPVSTAVLAQEVLPHIPEVPVFVAGGIGRGEAILSYLEMGAAGVQLGTRFVCAHESIAHANFKRAFIRASARDAVPSVQLDPRFPVIPVRALANPATERFPRSAARGDRALQRAANCRKRTRSSKSSISGPARCAAPSSTAMSKNGSLMAGQSVGLVTREQSTADILGELIEQALAAIGRRRRGSMEGDKPHPDVAQRSAAGGRDRGK